MVQGWLGSSLGQIVPDRSRRPGLELYDPKTKETTTIDTCFTWGHVNFDDNGVLWSSFGPAGIEGWFDTKIWDKTHDEKTAQGWSAFVLDYNGNGKRDAYTEPNQPADPAKESASTCRSTASRRRRTARCGDRCWGCPARWFVSSRDRTA